VTQNYYQLLLLYLKTVRTFEKILLSARIKFDPIKHLAVFKNKSFGGAGGPPAGG